MPNSESVISILCPTRAFSPVEKRVSQPKGRPPRWWARSARVTRGLLLLVLCLALHNLAGAQSWQLAWSDEFNDPPGSKIDSTKWGFDKGLSKNQRNELEYYCAPGDPTPCDPTNPNAFLDGSHLVIQPHMIDLDTLWTSARLKTKGLEDVQYGRIEASIQIPSRAGLAPVFSLLGSDFQHLGQPLAGELDLMQNWPLIGPTVNAVSVRGQGYSGFGTDFDSINFQYIFPDGQQVDTAFHVYGTIWSPGMVQFYVDDPSNVYFIVTANDIPPGDYWPFNNPFYMALGMAVGGDLGGFPDPGTEAAGPMLVDDVRYYQAEQVLGPTMSAGPITVRAGGTGTTTINLTSVSGTGLVYLACTGAPAHSTCSIDSGNKLNHAAVDFSTTSTATAQVTLASSVSTAGLTERPGPGLWAGLVGFGSLFGLVLFPERRRRRGRWFIWIGLAGLLLSLVTFEGCGGGAAAPGHYTLTVTAYTVSGDASSVTIPLTIN